MELVFLMQIEHPPPSSIKLMKMMSKKKDGLIHFIYTYTPTTNIYTWYC